MKSKKNLRYIVFSVLFLAGCNSYHKVVHKDSPLNSKPSSIVHSKKIDTVSLTTEQLMQNRDFSILRSSYDYAYEFLAGMLDGKHPHSFKDAVFVSESSYLNGALDYQRYNKSIENLVYYSNLIEKRNDSLFDYHYEDRATMSKHASIFTLLMDSIHITYSGDTFLHEPIKYNTIDFNGAIDWKSTFVSTLLETGYGNCSSMSYLYKILADEKGIKTHLALAPSHVYIKHTSIKNGMYNTELTSGTFPSDAWIMASGYVSLEAIQKGVYMEALTDEKMISLCLYDLAKNYEKSSGIGNGEFILKCCEKVLKHYPNYINAKLLTLKVLTKRVKEGNSTINLDKIVDEIYSLGYRQLPDKEYQMWLASIRSTVSDSIIIGTFKK